MSFARRPITRLEERASILTAIDTAYTTLETNVFTLSTISQTLSNASAFDSISVSNSDEAQLHARTDGKTPLGTYSFQSVQQSTTHQTMSKGFADSDQQTVGSGTITIATGGQLHQSTRLDSLNAGNGVRRGVIEITDRAGNSAEIDVSNTFTVDDVLDAINAASGVDVTAGTLGGRLVLTDQTGSSTSELNVVDLSGGFAALDLGIRQSVAAETLQGDDVYSATGSFALGQLNDGNGVQLLKGAPDVRITLTDDSQIDVNLDTASTLQGVVDAINDHEDNAGKVLADLVDGRLVLTDQSGGGGSSTFGVEDINGAFAVNALRLGNTAIGDTITGDALLAGINSVLLHNLRSGQGFDQLGEVQLTDRTGTTATVDLSATTSLDEVLTAINEAESDSAVKLQLTAAINTSGTGIEIRDTSGSTTGNLIIADVGAGTLAQQLGIAVDAAQASIDSDSLALRYVNESTSLSDYAPDGGAIAEGTFLITDSAGNEAVIDVNSSVKTIGDLLTRINASASISVSAELNNTGDGFVLIDQADGAGILTVEESGDGTTAADLRLTGEAVANGSEQRIDSRRAAVIEFTVEDTLDDVVQKINVFSGTVTASVFDDGSAFNSTRLRLTAGASGGDGRFFVDTGGLDLGLTTVTEGRNALLRVGSDAGTGFLITSSNDSFEDVVSGLDVTLLSSGSKTAVVNVEQNVGKTKAAIKTFVQNYNSYVSVSAELSKFDPDTNSRGILQGEGIVLRVATRLQNAVTKRLFGSDKSLQSLIDVGIRLGEGGKLVLNEGILEDVLKNDPDGVSDFFRDEENGFGVRFTETIESLTDPYTGTFSLEATGIQQSIKSLNERITDLEETHTRKRDRLLLKFAHQEELISQLQSVQGQIASIQLIGRTEI
ncbi:MAG: hypothetical protein CMJ48_12385 [Planctomycetaceae bacterium]|nr:hypothetical protein [Planctomycetaceae bacterium]